MTPAAEPIEGLDSHLTAVTNAIRQGRLIPFLGAGANLCDRAAGTVWDASRNVCLPTGRELADHLAHEFDCEGCEGDLIRTSQQISVTDGSGPLYERLHSIFDRDYEPTLLHHFLAALPRAARERGFPQGILIVTTNYDDLLEKAFEAAGEPVDIVTYVADPEERRGKFWHRAPNGTTVIIEAPNEYRDLKVDESATILKIHGTVARHSDTFENDSYVITEDHYIDYLARSDIQKLIPTAIVSRFRRANFLFLGYGLRDWNLRVILHRLWGERRLDYTSWAVQLNVGGLDRRYWMRRGIEIFDAPLDVYVRRLAERMEVVPAHS